MWVGRDLEDPPVPTSLLWQRLSGRGALWLLRNNLRNNLRNSASARTVL